ncbi:type II secretion system F family protein [Moorella sulfitireducens]|uniref:type II secretion system F family protein n=1 Tax=Neomoorella sulfitireducens TaxID=2972948 RepID=UPI0021ABDE91
MRFSYQARDGTGRRQQGQLEAGDAREALALLNNRGLVVLRLAPGKTAPGAGLGRLVPACLPRAQLALFSRQLAGMIGAGVPIINALETMARQSRNRTLAGILRQVVQDLHHGLFFWQALARHQPLIPRLYSSMIRAGEAGGSLEEVLKRLADHYEREHKVYTSLKGAMAYPLVVGCAAAGIAVFLVVGVLPRFAELFASMGGTLPAPTRLLLGLADFCRNRATLLLMLLLIAPVLLNLLCRREGFQEMRDLLALRLPVLGGINLQLLTARFGRTLATLVAGGIPVLEALDIGREVVGNRHLGRAVAAAREAVREGGSMALPLERSGLFAPMFIQMLQVGEETGHLVEMLDRMATFLEQETDAVLARLSALLEPLLVLMMAAVVGLMVAAIILPMFDAVTLV